MTVRTVLDECLLLVGVSIWVTSFFVSAFLVISGVLWPLFSPSWNAFLYLTFVACLTFVPLSKPPWSKWIVSTAIGCAMHYFSVRVKVKDEDALEAGQSYLIGYEPHSALPVGMPIVLNDNSPLCPPQLRGLHGLSSSLCFQMPLVRHLWWWLDMRPASRDSMTQILKSGKSVVLVPGGVREIHCVRNGKEVLYLRHRFGFVRLAMRTGSPLLPVMAFGQTAAYTPYPIGPPLIPESWTNALGRVTGVQPIFMLGRWGTTIPKRVPVLVVVGTPIPVPKVASPATEVVDHYLQKFISQMTDLFEEYKAEAGFPGLELEVV